MEILKQRPALQSLREKHFCQLACQVVPLHNKFYSQNIVIIFKFPNCNILSTTRFGEKPN